MIGLLKLPNDSKGNPPDMARSMEDWEEWDSEMKKDYPIRHFLNEEFASIFIWPITTRYKRVHDWVRYRTTRRMHIVKTGLEPGYYDADARMLHMNFNLLKDFVEVEKAHMFNVFGSNDDLKLNDRDAGIAYLKWEMSLEDTPHNQADNAKEIYELYKWWVDERPNRVDPWALVNDTLESTADNYKKKYSKMDKLEAKYEKEDNKMLVRLVKIRSALWT